MGETMSSRRFLASVLSAGIFWSLSCAYLNAQSTYGSISGTVTDASGAAVTGANVTLTNTSTSEKRTETSGDDGHYTFVNLFQGQYRIDVEKQGFKHFDRPNVIVQVQQDTHVDAALTVGQVSETVEVTSEAPPLQA
jgi:Carboxypeptidase regulatory-like domain